MEAEERHHAMILLDGRSPSNEWDTVPYAYEATLEASCFQDRFLHSLHAYWVLIFSYTYISVLWALVGFWLRPQQAPGQWWDLAAAPTESPALGALWEFRFGAHRQPGTLVGFGYGPH